MTAGSFSAPLYGGQVAFGDAVFERGSARIVAAATASAIARLIPTPPTSDMAWAASPMHNNPGLCQRGSRLTCTSRIFLMSSHEVKDSTEASGTSSATAERSVQSAGMQLLFRALGQEASRLEVAFAGDQRQRQSLGNTGSQLVFDLANGIQPKPSRRRTEPEFVAGEAALRAARWRYGRHRQR